MSDSLGERTSGSVVRPAQTGFVNRLRGWVKRYGLSYVSATVAAYIGYFTVRGITASDVAAAFGASVSESAGFFGPIIISEISAARAQAKRRLQTYGWKHTVGTIRDILMEFGLSELLDTGFIRPLAVGFFSRHLGPGVGILLGSNVADITFYAPSILFYEMRKKWTRMQAASLISKSGAHCGARELSDRVDALAKSEVFGSISTEDLEFFATMFKRRDAEDGEVICRRGDEASDFYVVQDGQVNICPRTDGQTAVSLGRSSVLGVYGMFTGGKRTATVIAKGEVTLLTLDYERFHRFMLAFPEGTIALLKAAVLRHITVEQAQASSSHDHDTVRALRLNAQSPEAAIGQPLIWNKDDLP